MSLLYRIRWGRVSLALLSFAALTSVSSAVFCDAEDEQIAALDGAALDEAARPDGKLLLDRPWIDHLPKDDKDPVNAMLFVDRSGERVGVVSRASVWRRHMEFFRWERKGADLALEFPQAGRTLPVKAKARTCDEAPEPMDLCLDLIVMKKAVRLYSSSKWSINDVDELDSLSASLPVAAEAGESVDLQALFTE